MKCIDDYKKSCNITDRTIIQLFKDILTKEIKNSHSTFNILCSDKMFQNRELAKEVHNILILFMEM